MPQFQAEMQVEFENIEGGKPLLRQVGEKEFVDAPGPADDQERCTLYRASQTRSQPGQRAPPQCRIGQRYGAGCVPAGTGARAPVARDGGERLSQLHAARARCRGCQKNRADFQLWAKLLTVRVRTTWPRLRPV